MPAVPAPAPGLIIRYDYLWADEQAEGRDQGKDRPACIVVVLDKPNMPQFVGVLPITHAPPMVAGGSIEIPAATRKRLGLDDAPSWVRVSEYNVELWPPPGLAIVPNTNEFAYGFIPPALFEKIRSAFESALAAGLAKQVYRRT